jgi:hypothetical protein
MEMQECVFFALWSTYKIFRTDENNEYSVALVCVFIVTLVCVCIVALVWVCIVAH